MTSVFREKQKKGRENHTERAVTEELVAWKMTTPLGPAVSWLRSQSKMCLSGQLLPKSVIRMLHMVLWIKGNRNEQEKGTWVNIREDKEHRKNLCEANGPCTSLLYIFVSRAHAVNPHMHPSTCAPAHAPLQCAPTHAPLRMHHCRTQSLSMKEDYQSPSAPNWACSIYTCTTWEFLALSPQTLTKQHRQDGGA